LWDLITQNKEAHEDGQVD